MIGDGLYVSLVGLAIVFLVLIILLVSITFLNLLERKKGIVGDSSEISEKSSSKDFSSLELTAALVGLSLALGDNKSTNTFSSESLIKFENSSWKALGQQRLFKGRGG
jgi:Na+-transporting methylmalonyl-CoA/oxaloacetate decarboxylase gamma subunit|tara:strand:- start:1431 stop:1754 length:324 start_codon:yes stop_codon:yes gene_type:complete